MSHKNIHREHLIIVCGRYKNNKLILYKIVILGDDEPDWNDKTENSSTILLILYESFSKLHLFV